MRQETEHTYRIAQLLAKAKTESLTGEETAELEAWRKAAPENERTYTRFMDDERLREDYRLFRQVDRERGLRTMQRRTQESRKLGRTRLWRATAASAAAVLLAAGSWLLTLKGEREPVPAMVEVTQVEPSRPTLRTGDGRVIPIDSISRMEEAGSVILRDDKGELVYSRHEGKVEEAKFHTVEIPRGAEFFLTLEDGTQVWLNAGTRLSFPSVFGPSERKVRLEGEAYFEVRHEAERPFRVEMGEETVEVLGTTFNVNAYPGERTYTTLVEGKVCVEDGRGGKVTLKPGEQRTGDAKGWSVRRVDTEEVTSWRKGMFVLEDQSLEDVMAQLERWYNFSVTYRDEKLKRITFKGKVPRYTAFRDILNVLEKTGGLRFEVNGRTVIVDNN